MMLGLILSGMAGTSSPANPAPQRIAAAAPGLFELRGEYLLTPRERGASHDTGPVLLLPMPLAYREQVPLTWSLDAEPRDAITTVRIETDGLGNSVAHVQLRRLGADGQVALRWRSIVLAAPRDFGGVPERAPMPASWPAETRRWLRSTRSAQAADPKIAAVARRIRDGSSDVMAILDSTRAAAGRIYAGQRGRCTELDAVQALERQGSCTSCANLVAALVRASGIPARILAGYPTWIGPMQTHYIVEAWVPNFGWYPIEATLLAAPWPPTGQIHVAIVPPEHEDRSAARRAAAGGVPYLALTEYGDNGAVFECTGTIDAATNCDHIAVAWRCFETQESPEAWDAVLQQARERWSTWLEATRGVAHVAPLRTPLEPVALESVSAITRLQRVLREGDPSP